MFAGPTILAVANNQETALEDLKALLTVDGKRDRLLFLGGSFQGAVVASTQLQTLKDMPYAEYPAHSLISVLKQPMSSMVRMLSYPQTSVVKVLAFKAEPAAEDEAPAAAE